MSKPLLCRLGLHKPSKEKYVTITRRHQSTHGGKYRTNYAICERCGKLCYRVRLRQRQKEGAL